TQRKVHFDFDLTFGQLLEQENKEKAKNVEHVVENEIEKYAEIEPFQEDEEYGDATDYVESYFDNGEADDAFDDDGGGGEAYFD
ncbi:2144_t:CDS:2, partial [Funneliformis caledonium]